MTRLAVFVALFALAAPAVAAAQNKPDFSGTWVLDPEKSESGLSTRTVTFKFPPETIVIKQTASEFTVERRVDDRTRTSVNKLDGSESTRTSNGATVKSVMKWTGAALVTTSLATLGQSTSEVTDTWSLSADGKVLTVETTTPQPTRGIVPMKKVYSRR